MAYENNTITRTPFENTSTPIHPEYIRATRINHRTGKKRVLIFGEIFNSGSHQKLKGFDTGGDFGLDRFGVLDKRRVTQPMDGFDGWTDAPPHVGQGKESVKTGSNLNVCPRRSGKFEFPAPVNLPRPLKMFVRLPGRTKVFAVIFTDVKSMCIRVFARWWSELGRKRTLAKSFLYIYKIYWSKYLFGFCSVSKKAWECRIIKNNHVLI